MNDNKYTVLDEEGVSTLVASVIKNFTTSKYYTELQKSVSDLHATYNELSTNLTSTGLPQEDLIPMNCTISKIDSDINQSNVVNISFTSDYPDGFTNGNTLVISATMKANDINYGIPTFVTFEKSLIKGFASIPNGVIGVNDAISMTLYLKKIT